MKHFVFLLLFFLLSFCACSFPCQQGDRELNVRVSVESENTENAEICVFVEGADGQIASGASVIVSDESNQITHIPFNTEKWCHAAHLAVSDTGVFRIRVNSILLKKTKEIVVPHCLVQVVPTINTIQDYAGTSVFLGENPDSTKDIQVAWNHCYDDVVYYVTIKDALSVVFSVSTEQNHVVIPAGTLEPQKNYYAMVQAQRIYGDPTFQSSYYYSLSTSTSPQVGFYVE